MQKWPAMDGPISFRDSTAPHISAVYSWRLNGRKLAWGGGVYALLHHNSCRVCCYWSIPSVQRPIEQKLCKNCTVLQKLRTPLTRHKLQKFSTKFALAKFCNAPIKFYGKQINVLHPILSAALLTEPQVTMRLLTAAQSTPVTLSTCSQSLSNNDHRTSEPIHPYTCTSLLFGDNANSVNNSFQ